jgi:hypothetical protein
LAVLRLDSTKTSFNWEKRKGQHFVCRCQTVARQRWFIVVGSSDWADDIERLMREAVAPVAD